MFFLPSVPPNRPSIIIRGIGPGSIFSLLIKAKTKIIYFRLSNSDKNNMVKLLEVVFDDSLSFCEHVEKLCTIISKRIYNMTTNI